LTLNHSNDSNNKLLNENNDIKHKMQESEKKLNESNIGIYNCLTKISLICEKLQNQSDAEQYSHRVINFYENYIQSSDTAVKLSAALSAELAHAYSLAKIRIVTKSDNP
jgi:hypothetical protein